jgi:hypothetical protein
MHIVKAKDRKFARCGRQAKREQQSAGAAHGPAKRRVSNAIGRQLRIITTVIAATRPARYRR